MFEQSFFYSLAFKLWGKLAFFTKFSFVARFIMAISGRASRVWGFSFAHKALQKEFGLDNSFKKGQSGRFFDAITRLAAASSNICGPRIVQSATIKVVGGLISNLPYVSSRALGCVLIFFGIGAMASELMLAYGVNFIYLALVLGGGLLVLLNRSFAGLFRGSIIMRWAGRFFFFGEMNERRLAQCRPIFCGILGGALGGLWAFVDPMTFIMLTGGAIGTILVLYRVEVGIFAAAFLIPIVPTMLVLGLFILIVFSFFIKVFLVGSIAIKFHLIDLFIMMFAGVVAYSIVISFNVASSLPVGLVYILFTLFYICAKNTINTRNKLMTTLSVILVSGTLVAVYGIYQRITGNFVMLDYWVDVDMFDETMVRVYSTLENPNVLGEYLIFVIVLSFGALYWYKEYLHKITALGVLGIAGVTMILTQSRGAWLGLIVAMVIFVMVRDRRLIPLGLLGLLAMPMILPPAILERFLSIGDMTDTSTAYRVFIWMASMDMIAVFWPIGIGLGTDTFMFMYHKFAFNAVFSPHSHMLYMQLVIDFGISGLIVFLAFMSWYFKSLLIASGRGSPARRAVAAALCAAMAGFLVQGFTDNVWFNYRVTAFYWLILALGAGLVAGWSETEDGGASDEQNFE